MRGQIDHILAIICKSRGPVGKNSLNRNCVREGRSSEDSAPLIHAVVASREPKWCVMTAEPGIMY